MDWMQIFIQIFATLATLVIISMLIYLPLKFLKSHKEIKSRIERIEQSANKRDN
ncbi:hypothetical protein RJG79_09185 [Mycoplasmatota bacterium WC44]